MGEVADNSRIYVTDHARWRAAERFRYFDTATIEDEVRAALAAGRIHRDRFLLGLARQMPGTPSPALFVFTEDHERIYALKVNERDEEEWIVTTTLRRGM